MDIIASAVHPSPFGKLVSRWTARGLHSLNWTQPTPAADPPVSDAAAIGDSPIERLGEQLEQFFANGFADFGDVVIDPAGWTDFSRRIYDCCEQIPPGETQTYKQLARAAGNERASRAVGAAMARNRVPIVIPCHRVIASGGGLCGFSAAGGLATKQWLLDLEQHQQVTA